MKALRIVTATGRGLDTQVVDIREVPVTQYSMMTRNGYINKTLGKALHSAVQSINNGLANRMWLEVI